MARRAWARPILFAMGISAGSAAAQLGLGYGLGIVAWTSAEPGAWTAGLVWATWVTATSVVIGAVTGDRIRGKVESGRFVRGAWRLVVSLAATLGAAAALPLVGLPARGAPIDNAFASHLVAGTYVAAGAVLGMVVALFATTSRAVAANVFLTSGWLWILAVIAMVDHPGSSTDHGHLAVWKFTEAGPMWMSFYIPGLLVMLGSALLVGGLAAFPAAARGEGRLGVAISGALGPAMVAAAYILAGRPADGAPAEQVSAFLAAAYLVVAGLAGSILVASVGGGFGRRPGAPEDDTTGGRPAA